MENDAMRHGFSTAMGAFALALATVSTPAVRAQSNDPAWLESLQTQLADEKQCEVAFFVRVTEDMLAGRRAYLARAQCVDGRQFDASKKEGDDAFAIRACQIEVC
jgi:hypothetical protein